MTKCVLLFVHVIFLLFLDWSVYYSIGTEHEYLKKCYFGFKSYRF